MEDIFVPASGMAMEDVLLVEWLKEPGDEVGAGEAVAVIETDKATVELSPVGGGRLGRHLFEAGQRVKAGTTIARLLGVGETESAGSDVAPDPSGATDPAEEDAGLTEAAGSAPPTPRKRAPHSLSPRQRRARAEASTTSPPPPDREFATTPSEPAAVASRDRFRQVLADAVVSSWTTIPHFSVGRDVDGGAVLASLERARRTTPETTVTDYLLLALADTLVAVGEPDDVGIAVATDDGVMIPILRSVASRQLEDVTRMRREAIERARTRRLIADDAATPFATLSNLGAMGVSWFTGVIPVGQAVLITIGELAPRPVVEGRGIAIRTTCSVTVTADHRRYDGADSARFLKLFAQAVESIGESSHR